MLTEQGLVYGKKMKRRHRLAEVLLNHLPFSGNQHATACRLEHAIDDDLEVALTIYLNDPKIDPSGTPIPTMSEDIEFRVNSAARAAWAGSERLETPPVFVVFPVVTIEIGVTSEPVPAVVGTRMSGSRSDDI